MVMIESAPLIRQRQTNKLEPEIVEAEGLTKNIWKPRWFNLGGVILTYHWPAKLYGWWQSQSWSRFKIPGFIKKHSLDEQEFQEPVSAFKSFNHFFTRRLKPQARPIAQPAERLISPGDGKLLVWPKIDDDEFFLLKDQPIRLREILKKNPQDLERYRNGSVMLLRLAPPDYHRFHLPDGGILYPTQEEKGTLYSVHPYAIAQKHPVYHLNAHHKTILKSDHYGSILLIEVGATFVGQIVRTAPSLTYLKKGTEKGYFRIGGSAILVLFEKNRVIFDEDLVEWSEKGIETQVKMGEGIGWPSKK